MTMKLTWFGHSAWLIETAEASIVLDPFLKDNPSSPRQPTELKVDTILVSHGHFDHLSDAASIANRCGATIVANFEIASWFEKNHGVQKTVGMNLGGKTRLPWGTVRMTIAWHSSVLPDGTYGGNPGGFVIEASGRKLYYAGDTALFGDMALIGSLGLDAAILPIGDLFTMGPEDSVEATQLLKPKHVLPTHYNTWPPIAQDPLAWAESIRASTPASPIVLQPGESFEI